MNSSTYFGGTIDVAISTGVTSYDISEDMVIIVIESEVCPGLEACWAAEEAIDDKSSFKVECKCS